MFTSGFTGYQVIQSLKRAYPHLANSLTHLQVAGFTGKQIVGMLKRGKGQKTSDEDFYDTLTEHERTMVNDEANKRKAKKQALGMAATAATLPFLSLKAYQLLKAGQPVMSILGPEAAAGRGAQATGQTLNVFRPQIDNQQRQLPNLQKQIPFERGQIPFQEGEMPPQAPQGPKSAFAHKLLPYHDYMQSVDLVTNLKENARFENVLNSGLDLMTTAQVLRSILKGDKRGKLGIFDKVPGGLDKVVDDYARFMQERPAPKKQAPQQVPPMQEPAAPPQAMQQVQQEQSQQIGPGRQRLQEIMEKLRGARQPQAPAPVAQQEPVASPIAPVVPEISIPKPVKHKKKDIEVAKKEISRLEKEAEKLKTKPSLALKRLQKAQELRQKFGL